MQGITFILIVLTTFSYGCCANILGIFAMPSYSHYTLGHRLFEELASKGHNVTMIAPYKQDKIIKNYNEIYLENLANIIREKKTVFFEMEDMYPINQIILCYHLGYTFTEFTYNYQPVIQLLHSNRTFDVVIMDQFLNEALLGIPYQLKAPVIYFSTLFTSIWNNHLVANAGPLAQVPNIFLNYDGKMGFSQRLHNWFVNTAEEIYRTFISFPRHNKILHKALPDAPHIYDLMYKQNMFILVNSHISINNPIPHMPNMIEIGGFHPKKSQLPKDLQEICDNAKNGIIYFGMGSNLKMALMPKDKLQAVLKALGKIKQTVLWKWEEDDLPGKPDNLIIRKWFPQQAILGHPNTKAFISHGGLLSTIEAVYFGVPVIGIPIYGDQKMNINLAVNRGYAVSVPFKQLTEETLSSALDKVLNNQTYKNTISERSTLMNDRLVSPLQEAIYWVEYVIKYKGAPHFRSDALGLKWYEYEMLDVGLFVAIVSIIFLTILFYGIKRMFKLFFKNTKVKKQ